MYELHHLRHTMRVYTSMVSHFREEERAIFKARRCQGSQVEQRSQRSRVVQPASPGESKFASIEYGGRGIPFAVCKYAVKSRGEAIV